MTRVPFKVKGGLDTNNEKIINVQDPIQESDGANKRYVDSVVAGDILYVNIMNVVSTDPSAPTDNTYTNGVFVESFKTAASEVTFTIRFNKNFTSKSLPNIQFAFNEEENPGEVTWISLFTTSEIEEIDYSQSTQTLTNGVLRILELDYIQTFEFEYTVDDIEAGFYYFKNGIYINTVESEQLVAPEILSAAYTTNYPGSQDELANGELVNIEVESDSDIYEIEVQGAYLINTGDTFGGTNSTETIQTVITAAPTSSDTGENAYFQIRVKDENGTWSGWYDSQTMGGGTDTEDYMVVNDTVPQFITQNISYSNSPLTALNLYSEDLSEVTVGYSAINFLGAGGSVTTQVIGDSGLDIIQNSNTNYTMRASTATYRFNTETARIIATRTKNGRTTNSAVNVNIASEDMVIGNMSVTTFRSSVAGLTTSFNIGTNQRITGANSELENISLPTGTTISNQGAPSGSQNRWDGAVLTVPDSSTKGEHTNSIRAKFIGLSGREVTKDFTITLAGFVSRNISPANIDNAIQIPEVANTSNLVVSLGPDTSNLVSRIYSNKDVNTVWSPGYIGNSAEDLEYQVYTSGGNWFIVFDNASYNAASAGGWNETATIRIEETI